MAVQTSPSSGDEKECGTTSEDVNGYRRRLIEGLASLLAEMNFRHITVADIVRRAHTSRRTFYEYFDSKEACLLALHRQANDDERHHTAAAIDRSAPWQEQMRQATQAWIAFVDTRPEITLSWLHDLPPLGDDGRELQREGTDRFINTIMAICGSEEFRAAGGRPISRQRALILLGGMERLAAETVQNGQKLATYTDEAVQAAIALMAPQHR